MKKNSLVDYSSYIAFKILEPFLRVLPLGWSHFLGRRLGDLFYYFDLRHKAIAYANIKIAMQTRLAPERIRRLTRAFYQSFGQNLIEMFLIPRLDKSYIDNHIAVEGLGHVHEALAKGKGVILVGVHAGSWELSNIISANLGFPFNLFVRDQNFRRLEELLNTYRCQKGCKLIQRKNQIRQLLEVLNNNEAVGMTLDQGGRGGTVVKFFGREASMATGALKLALQYDIPILPAYYTRIRGPYIKTIIAPVFKIKKTGSLENDVRENLQELTYLFEKFILDYPQEYLWTYKIWKYGTEKNILVLSDGKAGHLRQAESVAKMVSGYLKEKGMNAVIATQKIDFKNRCARAGLSFSSCLAGKYHCQGCLWCLRKFLKPEVYQALSRQSPDCIISCGASLAPINFVLSKESLAKSIVVMRPSFLSTKRFDLVVMPRHDNPPQRKNVVVTEGALNLIDEPYLQGQVEGLRKGHGVRASAQGLSIGVLIGGDTKNFSLPPRGVREVMAQIKTAAEKLNAELLVTTSRRTSRGIEQVVKEELGGYPRCALLVIANEKNIPEAVGGILGLSQIVVISPESISMISEAASAGRYVVVFDSPGLDSKHQRFIRHFVKNRYIYLAEEGGVGRMIADISAQRPAMSTPHDAHVIRQALTRIL